MLEHAGRHPDESFLSPCVFPPGAVIITKGQLVPAVYILVEGGLEVIDAADGLADAPVITTLGPPTVVGEIGRTAGGATMSLRVAPGPAAELLAMPLAAFEGIATEDPDGWGAYRALATERLTRDLRRVGTVTPPLVRALLTLSGESREEGQQGALLEKMTTDLLRQRADVFSWRQVAAGHAFIHQGEAVDAVAVLVQGTAEVFLQGKRVAEIEPGALLGEISALSGKTATATVSAGAEGAELLTISRDDFQRQVLGDAELRAQAREMALRRLNREAAGERLDPGCEEQLRLVRDQNTDALVRRQGITTISGDGVFKAINPEARAVYDGDQHLHPVDQKYRLLEAAEALLKAGWATGQILEAARGVAADSERQLDEAARLAAFTALAAKENAALEARAAAHRPGSVEPWRFERLVQRLLHLGWLTERLRQDPLITPDQVEGRDLEGRLKDLAAAGPDEAIDREYQALLELGVQEASEALYRELSTVMVSKVPVELEDFDQERAGADGLHTPPASVAKNHGYLDALRARLARGEASAIGGAHYPCQRFSGAVLDAVAEGTIQVLVCDGSPEAAEQEVRRRFGLDPESGRYWRAIKTEIQGLDGSGPRTLMTFLQGSGRVVQVLIIAGLGAARQLHNAGAIALYEDAAGRRVPPTHLHLYCEGLDYVALLRRDITGALRWLGERFAGREILGQPGEDPDALPVQPLVLQNPPELAAALGPDRVVLEKVDGALVPLWVGFLRLPEGTARLVVPKVGGKGLYGDTAGHFVTAVHTAGLGRVSPHLIFNGTAGGFACTAGTDPFAGLWGLGDISPGGIITPVETIEQVGDEAGPRKIRTLLNRGPATPEQAWQEVAAASGLAPAPEIHFVTHHSAVPAPAVETYEYIDELLEQGKGSVDVEGGAIWRAVEELRDPGLTFTPVYTHSDDPRSSKENPADSLAAMGPWFEGVELDRRKYQVVEAMLRRAMAL